MWGKLRRHSNGFSAVRLYFPFVPFILVDFPFFLFGFNFASFPVIFSRFPFVSCHVLLFLHVLPVPCHFPWIFISLSCPFSCSFIFLHFLSFSCRFLFNFLSLLMFLSFPATLLLCTLVSFHYSFFPFIFLLLFYRCFWFSFHVSFISLGFPFAFLSWHYFCFHFLYFRFIILISRMFLPFRFKRFHFISPFVNDGQTQRCKSKSVAKSSEVRGGILTATSLLIHLACVMTAWFSRRFNPNN